MRLDRTLVGFAVIGAFTYGIDLSLLWFCKSIIDLPLSVALTIGYTVALSLNFVLNRTFNFHAHGHFGTQAGKFLITVVVNFLVFVQGLVNLLVWAGIEFTVARMIAGAAEGLFLYVSMRFAIFREGRESVTELGFRSEAASMTFGSGTGDRSRFRQNPPASTP